jgi:hypothetical protein
MRKLLIVVSMLAMSSSAFAGDWHHRRAPPPPLRPYAGGHHNILPWVAGGLALGALGGAYYYNRPRPECWEELVGYDRRGREVWETVCN